MSMLSEQIEELRRKADELRFVHVDETSVGMLFAAMGAMREAADTIESLSDKLQGVMGTRYCELFGTPERAARTIMGKQLTYDLLTQCDDCPYQTDECYKPSGKCAMDEYDTLLEWLRGGAE